MFLRATRALVGYANKGAKLVCAKDVPILTMGRAGARSNAEIRYVDSGVSRAVGVYSATIDDVSHIAVSSNKRQYALSEPRRLAPKRLLNPYVRGGSTLVAYCRTLCCDQFKTGFEPSYPWLPDLDQSRKTLLDFLLHQKETIASGELENYLAQFRAWGKGR
ncbi:hypothetical protein ABVK25_006440 [Lepraria finkii]|uniref:Uncharacterized protein n=1 Tax=Lepraria finkii TaxID=1340010 RepID=A0ABR4B9A0_9LECA